jgi:carbonic anhydrase/acetyltransferase-like protein (isoleucine patch superfamily)
LERLVARIFEAAVNIVRLRAALRPWLVPAKPAFDALGRWRRRMVYVRYGIEGIAMQLRTSIDCAPLLREYGASVGRATTICGPLHIMNAEKDFSKLTIGHDVYIGTDVLIDLADRVTVEDFVSLGMRSNLITSFDVGPGPLSKRRPRKQGPIVISSGTYVGTQVTVLHGVTIGEQATIGAHCLIRKDIPAGATMITEQAHEFEP